MDEQLIDDIYACTFAPDLWPDVLDGLARVAGARGGVVFTANRASHTIRWSASRNLHDDMATYVAEGWYWKDHRSAAYRSLNPGCFVTERELFADRELECDPTFRGYHASRGRGRTVIMGVRLPTGDWFCVAAERDFASGPAGPDVVERVDRLRPHLSRSLLMAERLQMERARLASETLAIMGVPALVFDHQGKVVAANSLVDGMADHLEWRARDMVGIRDKSADAQLRQAVRTLAVDNVPTVRSFAVRDADGGAALVAHVVPIRGVARDVFSRCAGVMVLTPVTLPDAAPVELLQSLFDLSPAEARVARRLVAGHTVEEIAADGRVSSTTVRTQVRGVLEKTGCRRQAEVVALLGGVAVPRG